MDILLYGAAGFIWGLAVSIFNNFWGTKALKGDSKGTAMIIFPLRILIYGLAFSASEQVASQLLMTASLCLPNSERSSK